MRTRKSANAKILRTRTFSVAKSISKYLILPLQIIPFSNRPFFKFYFMVSVFNSFLLVSKFVPFLEIVWNSFFFFQKNRSLKKVTHSSFLCLSAHASPKALLPLRYLGPPTHKREIFPRYTYNSKKRVPNNNLEKKCRKESRTWSVWGYSPKWSTTQLAIDMRG